MNWYWDRCFMLRRLRPTSLVSFTAVCSPPPSRFLPEVLRSAFLQRPGMICVVISALVITASAQTLQSKASEIRGAMDSRDFARAESLVLALRSSDEAAFKNNNYDYLLARLLERRGARTEAARLYQTILERYSLLAQYALWHLALIAKNTDDLALERQYITRFLVSFPASVLVPIARERLVD